MPKTYIEIIAELEECLERECSDDTVAFELHINGTSTRFKFHKKTDRQLNREGTSMRNIKGEFIK